MLAFHELFASNFKTQIEAIIEDYMSKVAQKKEFDICSEVFYTLPADIIFTILGISKDELKNVKDWSASRLALTWGTKENQLENAHNIVKYWNFCKDLVIDRVTNPRNDLPSRLVAYYHKGEISLHEIQLLCYGLVFSGHATTSAFMTESFKLLQTTGKWQEIIENNIPFSQVADEMLRLCPSAFTRRRLALQDIQVGDKSFKKGDPLLLVIGSGNRDEDFFENPNDLVLNRKNASKHLAFGSGFHYCIGARLVKFEFTLVMEQIAKNFPQIKLSTNNDFSYSKNISIRALEKLNVLI